MKRTAEQQGKQQLSEQQAQALTKKELTLADLTQVTGGFALEMLGTRSYGVKTKASEAECIEQD